MRVEPEPQEFICVYGTQFDWAREQAHGALQTMRL